MSIYINDDSYDTGLNRKVAFNAVSDLIMDDGTVTEPITTDDAKTYAKIDIGTIDDTVIGWLITTSRQQCEDFAGISIIPRTVTAVLNNSCGGIFLPYCPLVALTSITDREGNVLTTDQYKISGTTFPQLIWPKQDRLILVYTTGYAALPQEIRMAVMQQFFYLYDNRGESAFISRSGNVAELTLSPQAKATLQRFRRVG